MKNVGFMYFVYLFLFFIISMKKSVEAKPDGYIRFIKNMLVLNFPKIFHFGHE